MSDGGTTDLWRASALTKLLQPLHELTQTVRHFAAAEAAWEALNSST